MLTRLKAAIGRLFSDENKIDIRNVRYLPRWAVLFIDTLLILVSALLTYFLLLDLHIQPLDVITNGQQLSLVIGVSFVFLLVFKTYAGLIRHSSFMDAMKLMFAIISTFSSLMAINLLLEEFYESKVFINTGLILFSFISFTALFSFRLAVKQLYEMKK